MDAKQIEPILQEYRQSYPALITIDQAMAIAAAPRNTIYDWSTRGLLDAIKVRRGRRVLLVRDGFVRWLLTDDNDDDNHHGHG